VTLLLNQSLVNNTYAVTARNIENASSGEIVEELQAVIRYEVRTNTRDIVINEIFADPFGDYLPDSVVLPNDSRAEFIELYNTSENAIDITGFELSGGKVDSLILETKGYVILTATANKEVYKSFGNVAGVTSWNTLTNTGEPVVLKDNLGYVVDSLQYDLTWYKDGEKENGSWSIEQINPEF